MLRGLLNASAARQAESGAAIIRATGTVRIQGQWGTMAQL